MKKKELINPCFNTIFLILGIFITLFTAETSTGQTAPRTAEKGKTLISSVRPSGTLDNSLRREVEAAIDRGLDWLAQQQKSDGSWSNSEFPAISALALQAFIHGDHPGKQKILKNGKDFIVSCAQENGGIYKEVDGRKGGGLSNYNTAICMTALHSTGDRSLTEMIQKARQFVSGNQYHGDDVYRGGFGYDRTTDRAYTDLLNTFYSVEAMRLTESVEDLRPTAQKRVDIDWDSTIKYIENIQNKPDAGVENSGGFFYKPGESKAGTVTNESGVVIFRSYGSMTYVGMLSLIYADVPRNDPRVMSAFHWSASHWSIEENPGMGQEGIFFFYNILTKCLTAFGRDVIPVKDGSFVDWRTDLAKKLVSKQQIDPKTGCGYWKNETGRFWENDPVLSTAYVLTTLEMLL